MTRPLRDFIGVAPGLAEPVPPIGDPWTWLHDNDFSWDDVNAIAAILGAGGFEVVAEALNPGRLARAMRAEDAKFGAEWRGGDKDWTWERHAEGIAREYAALGEEPHGPKDA